MGDDQDLGSLPPLPLIAASVICGAPYTLVFACSGGDLAQRLGNEFGPSELMAHRLPRLLGVCGVTPAIDAHRSACFDQIVHDLVTQPMPWYGYRASKTVFDEQRDALAPGPGLTEP